MMVCDIDSLRTINAKYGYDAGNHVLKVSAGLLAENRRNFDVLVRLAKDQFMFFMYGVDEPAAIRTAERIAVSVKETGYAHNGVLIPVAMSFGIKTFDLVPEELTPLRFMELADGEVARLGVRGSRHASGRLSDWTGRMEISGEKAATTA
jgi:diguanylate cyclase (GGDEF)-like protein